MKKNIYFFIKIFVIVILVFLILFVSLYDTKSFIVHDLDNEIKNTVVIDTIADKHKLIFVSNGKENENYKTIEEFILNTDMNNFLELKGLSTTDNDSMIFLSNVLTTPIVEDNTFILLDRTGYLKHVFDKNQDSSEIISFLKTYFDDYL